MQGIDKVVLRMHPRPDADELTTYLRYCTHRAASSSSSSGALFISPVDQVEADLVCAKGGERARSIWVRDPGGSPSI